MRTIVLGWFSFRLHGATAGDLMAKDVACDWLSSAGYAFDVAVDPAIGEGVDWKTVDPTRYTHLLFVCGPMWDTRSSNEVFLRFKHCVKMALGVSMLQHLAQWNPFDVLIERDSSSTTNPDLSIACTSSKVPVVGILKVSPQIEYGSRARHAIANKVIDDLVESRQVSRVLIDTELDDNQTGLRSAAEVESLIAKMDLVISTRLHGLVLAIKNGVPCIAVDAISGGAKVTAQAEALGWPVHFVADTVTSQDLDAAFIFCGTEAARQLALECAVGARRRLGELRSRFLRQIAGASVDAAVQ